MFLTDGPRVIFTVTSLLLGIPCYDIFAYSSSRVGKYQRPYIGEMMHSALNL